MCNKEGLPTLFTFHLQTSAENLIFWGARLFNQAAPGRIISNEAIACDEGG